MTRSRRIVGAVGAVVLAVVHFLFIYVIAALGCARGFAEMRWGTVGIVPAVNGLATLVAFVVAVILLIAAIGADRDDSDPHNLLRWLMGGLAAAAILAIAWNGLPLVFSPDCG